MSKEVGINLWTRKDTGNSLNHKTGLTQDQVNMLRELQVGDRLILFLNQNRDRDTSPHFTLKKHTPSFSGGEGGGDAQKSRGNNDGDSL